MTFRFYNINLSIILNNEQYEQNQQKNDLSTLFLHNLISVFKNQVTFRGAVKAFQTNKDLLQENAPEAISKISSLLDDVMIHHDDDIVEYDKGSDERFKEWSKRKEEKDNKDGLRGIKTPFSI